MWQVVSGAEGAVTHPTTSRRRKNSMNVEQVQTEMRVVGLRRSGNHAILNWILRQADPPVTHFNDVNPQCPYDEDVRVRVGDPSAKRLNWLIYSVEDTSLAILADKSSYPQRSRYEGLAIGRSLDLILLRDPFNFIASRFRKGGDWGRKSIYVSGLSPAQMWVTYAREFLGETNWLSNDAIRVNYNAWCVSKQYRSDLAQKLGLTFTDSGFQEVSRVGGGSSFDGTIMSGEAQSMSTGQRWRIFRDDDRYRDLFRDPLLLDLAEHMFDLDEDLRAYIRDELRPRASRSSALDRWWRSTFSQRAIARLRRSSMLRQMYGRFFRRWRARKLALPRRGK